MDEDGSADAEGQSGATSTESPGQAARAQGADQSSSDAHGADADARADAPAASGSADEMGEHAAAASATAAGEDAWQTADTPGQTDSAEAAAPATDAGAQAGMTTTTPQETTSAAEGAAPATGFLGDLVAAMRRVAEEARESTLAELRSRIDTGIRERETDAERRRNELRAQAETDIAGVGEWAKAEAERIKADAEQRVAARRAQLDRQLAAETSLAESGSDALRSRITAYERELEAYHAQLAAINDPAAFAAVAKRMPPPPDLDGSQAAAPPQAGPEPEPEPEPLAASAEAESQHAPETNGSAPTAPVADAEGADLPATDLEELDASAEAAAANEPETYAEPVATEIVVKGLGSFGSITGFRQQLANIEGIDAVGLSLGTSGEFVFRATHRPSLDMAAAVTALEGDAVEIEPRLEGGIRVTLGRPR